MCLKLTVRFQAPSRSKVNYGEADMAVALALFLLGQGVFVSEVTVLGAYLGQTKILRQKFREAKTKFPKLFESASDNENVDVQTIDLFQVRSLPTSISAPWS